LPDPETPAPPCFLPESDNALLSHADRTRIISEEYRRTLFKAPIMRGVLLDGFVCGTWKKERTREKATLLIEPFEPLATKERDSLAKKGSDSTDSSGRSRGVRGPVCRVLERPLGFVAEAAALVERRYGWHGWLGQGQRVRKRSTASDWIPGVLAYALP
jgi:hypothetical protein